jgi:hypothetical protein
VFQRFAVSYDKNNLQRLKLRWEDNVKIDFKTGYGSVDCIHLVQDRIWWQAVVNTVMNVLVF